MEELCDALSVPDKSGSDWSRTLAELCTRVRHHLKEEESKFFKVAGRELTDRQKATLARRYQAELLAMRRKIAADYHTVVQRADGGLATT